MAIKLAIALCALVLTVISIGFETVSRRKTAPFFRRVRVPGYIAISAALGIFVFGAANEYATKLQQEHLNSEIRTLRDSAQRTQSSLDAAQSLLETSIAEALRLKQTMRLLEESSRGQFARVAYTERYFDSFSEIGTELKDSNGEIIRPVEGDQIHWRVSCFGALPRPEELVDSSWCGHSYGNLLSNAYKFQLSGRSGHKTFIGTRSTGGPLVFERPYHSCAPVYEALVESSCSLEIQVKRELRDVQFSILNRRGYPPFDTGNPMDSRLCQMYERLYPDQRCADLIE